MAATLAEMIRCHDIRFSYPGTEAVLFDGIDIAIETPGFHAIFGPSGVGKSTFARIVAGDVTPHAGTVRIDGEQPCLYTYNRERLPGWSSIGSHLQKTTPSDRHALKARLIDHFGLSALQHRRFAQLSMGQCNRVNLLRYLLQDFGVLIMDESLVNVDTPTRHAILYEIKSRFPQACFLYISHDVVEVSRFCNDILVFRGAHKSPQTRRVKGQNHHAGTPLDKAALERSMLEIMNAV